MKQTLVGRVIATFGRHLLVRDADGEEVRARPFGRALTVVCGDEVRCRLDARHDEVHVVEVLPRRTALYRANVRGGAEPVVANLTRLLVVLAPLPAPDLFVVDRYLAAATAASLPATLVVNKSDLGIDAALARLGLDVPEAERGDIAAATRILEEILARLRPAGRVAIGRPEA